MMESLPDWTGVEMLISSRSFNLKPNMKVYF
jgi:hypothetical protein